MRKVDLEMNEKEKYEVIKKLVDANGNKTRAAIKLNLTRRQIDRLILKYKNEGKQAFVHGNRGKMPVNTVPEDVKQNIIDLYKNKYYDANFTHFTEFLVNEEKIYVSEFFVRSLLKENDIVSPKANRKTRREFVKKLHKKLESPNLSAKEQTKTIQTIVDVEDAHPRRPRCKYFGEVLQMDASVHNWFGDIDVHLHVAIDDSTGSIVGAYFDPQETLNGYYNVLHQVLINYGIPASFYTDKRTVFEYNKKSNQPVEKDTFTQFGYACHQLGIEIKTSSVPQAKGRVERLFGTLQSRLPIEMRLAGVTDINTANEFLNSYIKKFNAQFSLPINHSKSVFETQPSDEKINLILAVICERKIDHGHCIRIDNKYFKTFNSNNVAINHKQGTPSLVIRAFDGNVYASINDAVYALVEVPKHLSYSKIFDDKPLEIKERKRWIPPMNHPWRISAFNNHLSKQAHLKDKSA